MAKIVVLLLLLPVLASSAYADLIVSIDCGSTMTSTQEYIDDKSITWIGDDDLFDNGQSEAVETSNNDVSNVMSTLRVFKSSRKKNCYSISVDENLGQVLVRASFFYGNYDKKLSPPTFDLLFDANFWATVQTSLDQVVYYEVAYFVKNDTISVCLAQTQSGQFPFISALEVRSLGSNLYGHVDSNYALFLNSRVAYGASTTVRYPDDAYDRIWTPVRGGTGLTVVTSDAISIDTNTGDNPPEAVIQNAITPITTGTIVFTPTFPAKEVLIYATMYFSEVQQLDISQKRSFQIYKNNNPVSLPISPPYGTVTEMSVSNSTASTNTTFSLVATSDSTLPPLINAAELFYISDPLSAGTSSKDVEGLLELKKTFSKLDSWGGDPCLPYPYTWDWVNCSTDATPRVTALYLSGYDLEGPLPEFSSMDALEIINLHNNSLSDSIPDFLGTLPKLKELNLGDNSFSGPVPTSISKNKKLKLVVTGNPDLCVSGSKSCTSTSSDTDSTESSLDDSPPSGSKKKSSKLPVILGSVIPIFIVFWAVVGFLIIWNQKRKRAAVVATTTVNGGAIDGRAQAQQGAQANNGMFGKIGEVMMNEIKVNIQDQTTNEINNQINHEDQHDNHDNHDEKDYD